MLVPCWKHAATGAAEWLNALADAAQLCGVAIAICTVDTAGRRATALRSAALVTASLLLLVVAFASGSSALALLALLSYLISFGARLC